MAKQKKPARLPRPDHAVKEHRLFYSQFLLPRHTVDLKPEDLFDVDYQAGGDEAANVFVVAWDHRTQRCYTYHANEAPYQAQKAFL